MKKELDESTDMGRLFIAARSKYPHIRTFADIARQLDVTEALLTNWKRRGIPAKEIFGLSDAFSCNPRWLATSEGEMKEETKTNFGINIDEISLEKVKYFKEKIIPMSEEEFVAQKGLHEQAERFADIARRKESREGKESGNDQ